MHKNRLLFRNAAGIQVCQIHTISYGWIKKWKTDPDCDIRGLCHVSFSNDVQRDGSLPLTGRVLRLGEFNTGPEQLQSGGTRAGMVNTQAAVHSVLISLFHFSYMWEGPVFPRGSATVNSKLSFRDSLSGLMMYTMVLLFRSSWEKRCCTKLPARANRKTFIWWIWQEHAD